MSLFKAREWWTSADDEEELHSAGCLAVAALGNDRYGTDTIAISDPDISSIRLCRQDPGGEFGRIAPSVQALPLSFYSRASTPGTETGLSHSAAGVWFAHPVCRKYYIIIVVLFVSLYESLSEVKELAVAVLHPRVIAVYRLSGSGEQPFLEPVHSHALHHTAHSMVVGTFGRTTGEQCCLLSLVAIMHNPFSCV